jgi:hypothetical protein
MTRLLILALAWLALAAFIAAWVHAATRPVPSRWQDDDVQPPDPRTITLAEATGGVWTDGADGTVTYNGAPVTVWFDWRMGRSN